MSDVVLNPTFPADEFAKYQKRQLAEIEEVRAGARVPGRRTLLRSAL